MARLVVTLFFYRFFLHFWSPWTRKINQNCDFFKSYEEAVLEGKLAIEKSVKNWMLSDVPIICSLSGGLDSSLICSITSRLRNANKSGNNGWSDVSNDITSCGAITVTAAA